MGFDRVLCCGKAGHIVYDFIRWIQYIGGEHLRVIAAVWGWGVGGGIWFSIVCLCFTLKRGADGLNNWCGFWWCSAPHKFKQIVYIWLIN